MKRMFHVLFWLVLSILFPLKTLALHPTDSVNSTKQQKKYAVTITSRIHSMGFFSYTGRLISDYPAMDLYFNYNYSNKWGLSAFKVVDLIDSKSGNNFFLFLANKNFILTKRLNMNFYGGFILEQVHHFADHGSDFTANITTTYKLSKHITIDHTAMLGNLVLERSYADWVNRFRILYSSRHIDLTAYGWLNNKVFDNSSYSSAGLSVYYTRIPISERITIGGGITGLLMATSSDPASCPKKNGVLFTVAASWH
jgi:hypothetical protein